MSMRWTIFLFLFAVMAGESPSLGFAQGVDSTMTLPARLAGLRATVRERDSLVALTDSTQGASREVLEEQVGQRDVELHNGLLAVVDSIELAGSRGSDESESKRLLSQEVRKYWPRYMARLERRRRTLIQMGLDSEAAEGAARLTIESEMTRESERQVVAYEGLVDEVLAMERAGIDVAEQRRFLVSRLPTIAEGLVTRVQLASRDRASVVARLSRDATSADLRYALDSAEERLKRATHGLTVAIHLMQRLGLETTDLRVAMIASTGLLSTDILQWRVLTGLMKTFWTRIIESLARQAPQWLFQGLLILLTFLGFRAASRLVRRGVRQAVRFSNLSELIRGTIIRLSGNVVMLIGFVVILTQIGVQVAPLLAGFGIAGVVVGFAMQSTLSNFAAGFMILGNNPFDIGDEIEVAGVIGTVKHMSLVSTTILTADNQTLVVPNSTVWGGVIRNRTTQPNRRVDLTFCIGYRDDVEKAERVLRAIVEQEPKVLKDPPPVIKLHQLADSAVNFVVWAWTTKEEYWNVYWDLTRAVKMRFDEEGITIPFPQRELHVNLGQSAEIVPTIRDAPPPNP